MANEIFVVKRDGTTVPYDIERIHKVLYWAIEKVKGVSISDIEMKSELQIKSGIKTSDIHKILIKAAADLISVRNPNYQIVAARLLLLDLRKEVLGGFQPVHLKHLIKDNIENGSYDPLVLQRYTEREINKLNGYLNHKRDFEFTYAGLQQVVDKYLLKNRDINKIHETPQYMYMMIAATLFMNYPKETRLDYVKKYYDAISLFKLNIPTPVMCGARTPLRQYSSCVLVDVADSLDSLTAGFNSVTRYTAQRAGIGLNMGSIRAIGSSIRSGEVIHTGAVPFLKVFESIVKSCTQNGVRGGSATVHFPFWHAEIEDIIVLKNNKGTDENRVRKLDYSIQMCELFYKRALANEELTLFSPHEVPELEEAFGTSSFEEVYEKCERRHRHNIKKSKVNAMKLFLEIVKERIETGRIYIMNIDHCNSHSSFLDKITMSNLCLTGDAIVEVEIDGKAVSVQLKELDDAFKGGKSISILSRDVESGNVEYKPVSASAMTAENAKLMKITDEEAGFSIRCTPDHKIFTKNRGYVEAKNLRSDDELDIKK